MRMVAPRTGAEEVTLGEEQLEYKPLVAALYVVGGRRVMLTRWRFTDEERERIMAGEDLYLAVEASGMPPLYMQVGPEGWT